MQIPRSYWYYWHTGNKPVAVTSMILNAALMWLVLVVSAGLSIWGIILAVLLDSLGFWVAVIYFIALRSYLPGIMQEQGDELVLYQFVIPLGIAFVGARLITLWVAKLDPQWLKKGGIALVGLVVVSGVVALKIQHDQNIALEKAAAQAGAVEKLQATATQLTDDAVKTVTDTANGAAESVSQTAGQVTAASEELADDAANSASQVADGVKQKFSDTCESVADSLGKNPDEYCK